MMLTKFTTAPPASIQALPIHGIPISVLMTQFKLGFLQYIIDKYQQKKLWRQGRLQQHLETFEIYSKVVPISFL